MTTAVFAFAFEPRYRSLLALLGVTPGRASVSVTADGMRARFGWWTCETSLDNVRSAEVAGPYRWYRVIGARGSFVDRGLTFGTTTAAGVCITFHDPVTGLDPLGIVRHPGLTVTVADPQRLVTVLRARGPRIA
jgi:hypothetical protein